MIAGEAECKALGRPIKYTAAALRAGTDRYFDSISREAVLTSKRDSGMRDQFGHPIMYEIPIYNKLDEPMKVTEYIIPPTVGGLCAFLGIHRSTWWEYCDRERNPWFAEITEDVRDRLKTWREEQLVTRDSVRGIIFDLQNNYGYTGKQELELGPEARKAMAAQAVPVSDREALLRELAREFWNDDEPES